MTRRTKTVRFQPSINRLEPRETPAFGPITLNAMGTGGATLVGFEDTAFAGRSVSGAGDVNGDGFSDVVIGAYLTHAGGTARGEAYVVFGSPSLGGQRLGLNPPLGFTLRGFEDSAFAGQSVSGAGDVNGDGFADVIVGAPRTNVGGTDRGEAYVVFGGPSRASTIVTLNNLGTGGFTLRGFTNGTYTGRCVSGAGDVNGDGFADVVVAADRASAEGFDRGEVYVVFGGPGRAGATITLNALGTDGFTLRGFENGAQAGYNAVSGAGDVNGDGFADVIVGASRTDVGGLDRGEAYVVFGGPSRAGTTITLNALASGGFTLRGFELGGFAGLGVSGAGDMNGDGFADVIVGAVFADAGGDNRGESYVVFGGPSLGSATMTLNALGGAGFTIRGFENLARAGESVAGAGDVNGDGFGDVIVGAWPTNVDGYRRGEAYVIFGAAGRGGTALTLNALGANGFSLRGFQDIAYAGRSVAGAGDVNGDGLADLLVGAPFTNAGGDRRGEAYVVFSPAAAYHAVGAGPGRPPTVKVYDALNGRLHFQFQAFAPTFTGGVQVAVGDVTGDGTPDIIAGVGSNGPPTVRVFDGRTFALVRDFNAYDVTFTGGVNIGAADLNGDGKAEIITAPGPTGGPHVKVFNGFDNILLFSFFAYAPTFTGGVNMSVGDVSGDTVPDIVTGTGPTGGPHVKVFSGVNTTVIREFFAYGGNFTGGVIQSVGDVNGDGRADIVTSAGPGGGPHVKVFSGIDNVILKEFLAYAPTFTGGVRVAAVDVDGDRKADILTGAGSTGASHVRLFRGADLVELRGFLAFDPGFLGGVYVAAGRS